MKNGGVFDMNALMFAAANKMMTVLNNPMLGADEDNPLTPDYNEATGEWVGQWAWIDTVTDAIKSVLLPLLILLATAGIIYVIILGVNLARAESADKQKEAKQRMVNFIVAIVVTIALVLLMYLVCEYLPDWIEPRKVTTTS